jgi:signal transduction histidine kinase
MLRTDMQPGTRAGEFTGFPTAGVVHDLGNLIQIASSALNIMARNPNIRTSGLEPVIAGARTSLDQASALVRRTIGAAHAEEAIEVSLPDCLAEIEAVVAGNWEGMARLHVHIVSNLPQVRCDPLGLKNAVLNLLFNARDAMPDGGVILLRAEEADEGHVEVRVSDSGVGMKPETVARAFDPFFTTKPGGMGGVGLPMVKRFAEEAGGIVLIESEFGVGTTVILKMPASRILTDTERG